jgi:hypothetical protein
MAASTEADYLHSSSLSSNNPVNAIFDDEAVGGRDL